MDQKGEIKENGKTLEPRYKKDKNYTLFSASSLSDVDLLDFVLWGDAITPPLNVLKCNEEYLCNNLTGGCILPEGFSFDPCEDVICGPGFECDNGSYVSVTGGSGCDTICPPGYRCVGGECEPY